MISTRLFSGVAFRSHRCVRYLFAPIPRQELITKEKARLRDRPFLPGSSDGGFPKFLAEPTESFPHAVQVQRVLSLEESAATVRKYIDENLVQQGAILFRGLPLRTVDDYAAFQIHLGYDAMGYEGGSGLRTMVNKDATIYTASEIPTGDSLYLHGDMAYSSISPHKVFLWCLQEPGDGCGGETPVLKNRDFPSKLDQDVVRKLVEKGVLYRRVAPDKSEVDYVNWQSVFETEDRKVAEKRLVEHKYSFEWDRHGRLIYWQVLPAFKEHHTTKEKFWFNQATFCHVSYLKASSAFVDDGLPDDLYALQSYYGDGSGIEPEVLQHIRALSWQCAVGFRWRSGDLLALDNMVVQHSRLSYKEPRKVLLCLTSN